ncbi:MAG: alpha/beta hydrolase [Aestuariivita sp.]|nr:alpha/beta hydrolase [Aestuariivita sp.]
MPKFQTSDGLSLHFTDEGDGFPILCLAGLTRCSADFDYVTPYLRENRLIKLDYRGRGQSDWAKDPLSYSIAVESEDVIALLDHLGLQKTAILGSSRGGLIALWLGSIAKHRLLGVAFNDIGPELQPSGLGNILEYLGRNPVWKTYEEAAREREKSMSGFVAVPVKRWLTEVKKLYAQCDDGLTIRYDPRLRDATVAATTHPAPDMWPLFDNLRDMPLALIRGANSDLLSSQTVKDMKHRNPDLITTDVANRGHIPFLDEPEAVMALHQWLQKMQ